MTASSVQQYRRLAELCRQRADEVPRPESRARWLELSQGWLALSMDAHDTHDGSQMNGATAGDAS